MNCISLSRSVELFFHNFPVIAFFPVLYSLIAPLFETHCSYVEAKLAHFLSWTQDEAGADVGPFCEYPKSEYWAYADYKYIAMLFQDLPSMFEVIHIHLNIRSVL